MSLSEKISKFVIELLTDLKYEELTKFEETVVQGIAIIIILIVVLIIKI